MLLPDTAEESCDPHQIAAEAPSHTWALDRLSAVARTEHAAILAAEKSTTAGYWRLGQVLHLARKQFAHGQWLRYLQELEIEKTRAVKAMRIFESFSTEAQTKELTVAAAYDQRRRRPRAAAQRRNADAEEGAQSVDTPTAVVSSSWPRFAAVIVDEVERRWDETEFLTAAEAAEALTATERAAAALHSLTERLRERSRLHGSTSS